VRELGFLHGHQEQRPGAQVEGHLALVLERAVPGDPFVEELVDPVGRLAEEEAAVAARRAGADPATVDDEDAPAGLRERARRRAAGDAGADDDCVGRT
jgi:hypothetical protein